MKITVKVKLTPNEDQKKSLLSTFQKFNYACNFISSKAFEHQEFGQVGLHHLCYREVREQFNLSAQFTVRAIGKVKESYKTDRTKAHIFKDYSAVVYDDRLLSFRNLSIASILTVDGRYKIPVVFGSYAKLEQRRICGQADLTYEQGKFYLNLVVDLPECPEIESSGIIGVDLGIVNLATTSEGHLFSGNAVNKVRTRITKLRTSLQSCGSRSAKRHLKKISRKERNFKKNTNHVISKRIVSRAKDTGSAIALEDLKGFRKTVHKEQREQFGKWAFDELGQFITYKAKLSGIPVIKVNPKNTSRECSCCGHTSKNNRKSQAEFICEKCRFTENADINAAINIKHRAFVNMPIAAYPSAPKVLDRATSLSL